MAGPHFTFHLSPGEACDILGISPCSPAPDYAVMRSYMRRLQMLLHPDHVVSGGNAARAQQELGFTFVALREVEEWLFTKPAADEYPRRISQLLNAAKASGSSWVSHWNPHKLDGGDMFSPLPAWPHQESKPTAARRKAPGSSSSSTRFPCTSTASSSTRRPPPNPNAGTSNRTSTGTGTSTNNPAADHPTPPPRIDPTTYLDPTNPLRGSHLTPAPPTTHTLLTTALATLPLPRALSHFPPFSGTPHSPDSTPHLLRHLAHPFSPARPLSIGIAIATVALSWPSWDRLTTHTAVAEAVVEVPTWIRGMAGDESVVTGLPVALVLKAEDGRAVEEGEGGERCVGLEQPGVRLRHLVSGEGTAAWPAGAAPRAGGGPWEVKFRTVAWKGVFGCLGQGWDVRYLGALLAGVRKALDGE